MTWLSASGLTSNFTVDCPTSAGGLATFTLVATATSNFTTDSITCATQYQTIYVRNTNCEPALSLSCTTGTSGAPLICNETMLTLTSAANCTLVGGRYVSPITVACPAASSTTTQAILRAVSDPNNGGVGCQEQNITLYYRSNGEQRHGQT